MEPSHYVRLARLRLLVLSAFCALLLLGTGGAAEAGWFGNDGKVVPAATAERVPFSDDGEAAKGADAVHVPMTFTTLPATTTTTAPPPTTTTTTTAPAPTTTTMVFVAPVPAVAEVAPAAAPPAAAGDEVWHRLAGCEASGNWAANTGNGYYGGLQFSVSSWQAAGGTGMPHEASPADQITAGRALQAMQGWGAWPTCSRKLGLR